MKNTIKIKENLIPDYVKSIGETLTKRGFESYLVGGAVRDIILERTPKDYDIATNAKPEEIITIFPKSVMTGAAFGNIIVLAKDQNGETFDVDVTTFRREADYFGGRWPSKVEFTTKIEEDLSRRDFTINAMAIDLSTCEELYKKIIDPFEGLGDLVEQKIRAVGDPDERFQEDGLRSFKACRLASELGFSITPATFKSIKKNTAIASRISMERIRDEFKKLLYNSPLPSIGVKLLEEANLLPIFLPELLENKNITQPKWHKDDVYTHSLKTLDLAEDSIKLAALLHDIGKARTISKEDGEVHFYGHDKVGAEMAEEVLKRLRFPKHEIQRVKSLVRWHMFYYPSADWRKENDIESLETHHKSNTHGWSDAAIRRFIKNIGGEDILDDLFRLRIADASSNEMSKFNPKELIALEERVTKVRREESALKITDLQINGKDLLNMGITPGPLYGKILNRLLDVVLEEPNKNTREKLKKIVRSEFV